MPMQAQRWSRNEQSLIRTSSVGRPISLPSMPRPDFSEMQSSTVSKVQCSMTTRRQESMSMPSAPPLIVTPRNSTSSQ